MSLIQTTKIHRKKTQNTDTKESNTHDRISTEKTDRKTFLQHCGNIENRSKKITTLFTRIYGYYHNSIQ